MAKMAVVTMGPSLDKKENLQKFTKYVEEAASQDVKLIVFPELSLNGLPPKFTMASTDSESTAIWLNQAEHIPGGESTKYLEGLAKKHDMYICFSMVEQDTEFVDAYYNTAVLIGPEGFVGKYRKLMSAGTEAMYFSQGNDIPVFDTKYGKVGMMICMDKTAQEIVRSLKIRGACMILNPTGWPVVDRRNGEEDYFLNLDRMYDQVSCVSNNVVLLEANLCAPGVTEGPAEAGHSRIVHPFGNVLVEGDFNEGMCVAEVDPIAMQREFYTIFNGAVSQNPMKNLRSDIYTRIYQEHMDRR